MGNNLSAEDLLRAFSENPKGFIEEGGGYQLLNKYFDGYPLETLRPFLQATAVEVRREAMSILSEMGLQGCNLIGDAVNLTNDDDVRTRYDALETVFLCSEKTNSEKFVHVVYALDAKEDVIHNLALRLISNASDMQLRATLNHLTNDDDKHGIQFLLNIPFDLEKARDMMHKQLISKVYVKIAVMRNPELREESRE